MDGKKVIPRDEAVARIRAAVEERNTGMVILASALSIFLH
jgi:2-methylisocitrate lyase-like PEP mutase family enzyme